MATQGQTSVPAEILTDAVVEEIKTRVCLVGKAFELSAEDSRPSQPQQPPYHPISGYDVTDVDHPSSDAVQSELEFSRASMDVDSPAPGSRVVSSSYSVVSTAESQGTSSSHPDESSGSQVLADLYKRHSTANDIQVPVTPPASSGGLGRGVLVIPGWIRERAAEVLFEGGDVDEVSVAEIILDSLLKVNHSFRRGLIIPRLTSYHHSGSSRPSEDNGFCHLDCRGYSNDARIHTKIPRGNCSSSLTSPFSTTPILKTKGETPTTALRSIRASQTTLATFCHPQ